MPIITTLRIRVGAWRSLVIATEKSRDALQTLLDHPHPISERRQEDFLRERMARIEEALAAAQEELAYSEREYITAERALSPPVPANS